jgi:sterol 24-C-methyltransferase
MSSREGTTESRELPAPGIANVCKKPYDGKIMENVSSYCDHFSQSGEKEEDFDYKSRTEKTGDIVRSFYTLVTDFYEYGYGPCFHFAPVPDGKSFSECLAEYEHEIARTLNAGPGKKILDIGCGIGGPAREVARCSGASVTGLNICDYQVKRAREANRKSGLQHLVSFVQGDYTKMEFSDNSFDGLYALESTLYAKKPVDVYREVHRVLKPGALFVDSAWVMTDLYDPSNPDHVKIKSLIEFGNGIHEMRTVKEVLAGVKEAGLDLVGFKDCTHEGDRPWYVFLQGENSCSMQNFRVSTFGRWTTHIVLNILETVRIVPQGSSKVHNVLLAGADGLIAGGKTGIFTPMFRIVGRKPPVTE